MLNSGSLIHLKKYQKDPLHMETLINTELADKNYP